MLYLVPETGTRKIWYQIAWHTYQFLVPVFWYQFLVPVSGQYVMGISRENGGFRHRTYWKHLRAM